MRRPNRPLLARPSSSSLPSSSTLRISLSIVKTLGSLFSKRYFFIHPAAEVSPQKRELQLRFTEMQVEPLGRSRGRYRLPVNSIIQESVYTDHKFRLVPRALIFVNSIVNQSRGLPAYRGKKKREECE